ncbi:MAG: P-II family nitrogen regulator [Lachnospiraceae bacterium]
MKEIFAIIRPKMVNATKNALAEIGFPGITAMSAMGRGWQRGIHEEVNVEMRMKALAQGFSRGMDYIPKRFLSIVVKDEDLETVVKTIIQVNQTSKIGDGKSFVCPVTKTIGVRTGEVCDSAEE